MKSKELDAVFDALIVIESIASGSTTANSLPNLARIAKQALIDFNNSPESRGGSILGPPPLLAYERIMEMWRDCGWASNDGNALKFARLIEQDVSKQFK